MNQTLKDIIVSACEELRCSYEDNAAWFMVLADECLKTTRSPNVIDPNKKTEVEVYDNKVVLPTSCLSVSFINSSIDMGQSTMYIPHIEYVVQGNLVIFATDLSISDGDKVYIQYKGLRTDEDGNIVIDPRWVRMIVAYIGWKYSRQNYDKIPRDIMVNYHTEFKTQKLANI